MGVSMRERWLWAVTLACVLQVPAAGQNDKIRARISGGGGDGKCTFEVVVDGVAEIEIRGDEGFLRTVSGNPARWRRLDCNQAMPPNPYDFQFHGVDGRGRQNLVRDPNQNRGSAVIRIEDPQGGSEGYTGDLVWRIGSAGPAPGPGPGLGPSPGPGRGGDWGGGNSGGGWGGQGWNNGWGQTIRFTGRGSGGFDRDGGPRYDLRGVTVSVDRPTGAVTASFDTNAGRSTISFVGRITLINSDIITADLVSGRHRDTDARAGGRMRIRIDRDRTVRSIDVDGKVDNGPFRLNWRN